MVNVSNFTVPTISFTEPMGFLTLLIGVALIVIAAYIVFKVIKNLIMNAIIGGIGFIGMYFLGPIIGLEIEISLMNILIALIAGLPGLVIILVLTIFSL